MSSFNVSSLNGKRITAAAVRTSTGVSTVPKKCGGCADKVSVDAVQGSSASGPFGLRLPFQIKPKELRVTFLATPKYGVDPTKHNICYNCASESPELCARVGVTLPEPSSSNCRASNDAGTTAVSSRMDSNDQPAEPEATAAFGAHVCRTLLWLLACAIAAAAGCALDGVQPLMRMQRGSWKSLVKGSLQLGRSATPLLACKRRSACAFEAVGAVIGPRSCRDCTGFMVSSSSFSKATATRSRRSPVRPCSSSCSQSSRWRASRTTRFSSWPRCPPTSVLA